MNTSSGQHVIARNGMGILLVHLLLSGFLSLYVGAHLSVCLNGMFPSTGITVLLIISIWGMLAGITIKLRRALLKRFEVFGDVWTYGLLLSLLCVVFLLFKDRSEWSTFEFPHNIALVSTNALESLSTTSQFQKGHDFPLSDWENLDYDLISSLSPTNILSHKNYIEKLWRDSGDARGLINQSTHYSAITDYEPEKFEDFGVIEWDFKLMRYLTYAYSSYSLLKAAEGDHQEAWAIIRELYDFTQKGYEGCTHRVSILISIAAMNVSLHTVYWIVTDYEAPEDVVDDMRARFSPGPYHMTTLQNMIIVDHDWELWRSGKYYQRLTSSERNEPLGPFQRLVFWLTYKPNRVEHLLTDYYDELYHGFESGYDGVITAHRDFYRNLIESVVWASHDRYFFDEWYGSSVEDLDDSTVKYFVKNEIHSDLLYVVLSERGSSLDVPIDRYSGEEYQKDDESGIWYSVGPDGEAGTDDDISLTD